MNDDGGAGSGANEFDPDRNAEQIEELREISRETAEKVPHALAIIIAFSVPYLLVEFGSSVGITHDFSPAFETIATLGTIVFVGGGLLITSFLVFLSVVSRGLAWWVERRDARPRGTGGPNERQKASAAGGG